MKSVRLAAIAILLIVLESCAGTQPQEALTTVSSVDLARYAGTWYEIARLPMSFQRHCVDTKAVYTLRPDGTIGVHNECVTNSGGVAQVDGVATVVESATNARLKVVFDNWFTRLFGWSREGNYWILDLDPEYRTSLVGTPDRRLLWILSRSPHLDDATYQRLVDRGRMLGFSVWDLIRTRRPPSP
jgi:apolipoprotein D and lipocalin family protein